MKNYKVWNMHGEEGDNLPEETIQGPLPETITNETLQQTFHEAVSETVQETVHELVSEAVQETTNETGRDTLLDTKVLDALDKMIRDGEPEFLDARNLKKLEQMRKDAKTPLFDGSSMTKLEANLWLLEMKSRNGPSDKGFDDLLNHLKSKMLPWPNELPENTYQVKQMICPLGLEVQKIHACYNYCILYRGKYAEYDQCPVCELSRYKCEDCPEAMTIAEKNKRPAKKVVWYFPIIPYRGGYFEQKENQVDVVASRRVLE